MGKDFRGSLYDDEMSDLGSLQDDEILDYERLEGLFLFYKEIETRLEKSGAPVRLGDDVFLRASMGHPVRFLKHVIDVFSDFRKTAAGVDDRAGFMALMMDRADYVLPYALEGVSSDQLDAVLPKHEDMAKIASFSRKKGFQNFADVLEHKIPPMNFK